MNARALDVTAQDQLLINQFGRQNTRLHEIEAELTHQKRNLENFEDASSELMINTSGQVQVFIGDSFVTCSEEFATDYCEKKIAKVRDGIAKLEEEKTETKNSLAELKRILYSKFGGTINLEE